MSFADDRRTMIKRGEGSIPHMYLDIVGYVTVGVGNMLPNVAAAQALDFVRRDGGVPASVEEIAADFAAVKDCPYGQSYAAGYYRPHTTLELPEAAIDALLDRRIAGFEEGLARDFVGYANFPERAKLGLMDMAFNLGNHGLVTKFPSFTRAAREGNWAECAAECRRLGIGQERNDEVRRLFEEAEEEI